MANELSEAPIRRRSSFFERRLSIPVAPELSEPKLNAENIKRLYKVKLESELQAWKTFSQERAARINQEENKKISYTELTSEDLNRLMEMKPDIAAIKRDSIQFCKDYKITIEMNEEYNKSNKRIIQFVQNFINEAKGCILDKSIIDSIKK